MLKIFTEHTRCPPLNVSNNVSFLFVNNLRDAITHAIFVYLPISLIKFYARIFPSRQEIKRKNRTLRTYLYIVWESCFHARRSECVIARVVIRNDITLIRSFHARVKTILIQNRHVFPTTRPNICLHFIFLLRHYHFNKLEYLLLT